MYGFANGDPVNFADPFGLCGIGKILTAAEQARCLEQSAGVTSEEAEWAVANKADALLAAQARLIGGEFGRQIAGVFGGNERTENAARHLMGTCWMAAVAGGARARRVAEAHETNSPGSAADDTRTDRANNERGVKAGTQAAADGADKTTAVDVCKSRTTSFIMNGQFAR